jgi:hypothetical protein
MKYPFSSNGWVNNPSSDMVAYCLRYNRPETQKEAPMKTDISLVSTVIVAVIYACGVFALMVYIVHSLALAMMQARSIVEGMEMVF